MISADAISDMAGFSKSSPVEVTFSGTKNPIHFQQEDYEAIVLPPIETEEGKKDLNLGDDQTEIGQ